MRPANIFNLGVKELRSLMRDPILLVLIAYAFTVAVYTAAATMPESLNRAAIAIVDEDRSALSTRIVHSFYPPYFTPPKLLTAEQMDAGLNNGSITFALDIPPNFQRDVLAGRKAEIQLNVDATRVSQAFTGAGYIETIVTTEVAAFVQRYRTATVLPVDLAMRIRFNPTLNKAWFGAVVEVINQVTLLAIILTGAALIREREHGTIEHLLVMPVTPQPRGPLSAHLLEHLRPEVWELPPVDVAPATDVLASVDGAPVLVRQGAVLAAAFHPELSGDLRLHHQIRGGAARAQAPDEK